MGLSCITSTVQKISLRRARKARQPIERTRIWERRTLQQIPRIARTCLSLALFITSVSRFTSVGDGTVILMRGKLAVARTGSHLPLT